MIRQIRFLKGECGWVNLPDGAIKPGVVNGNEVINVKLKDLGMGFVPPQEKRIIAVLS